MSTFLGIDIFRYRKNMKRYNMTSLPAVIALKVVSKINTFLLISKIKTSKILIYQYFFKMHKHPPPPTQMKDAWSPAAVVASKNFFIVVSKSVWLYYLSFFWYWKRTNVTIWLLSIMQCCRQHTHDHSLTALIDKRAEVSANFCVISTSIGSIENSIKNQYISWYRIKVW